MDNHDRTHPISRAVADLPFAVLGAVALAGLTATAVTLSRGRAATRPKTAREKRAALAAYLREHLSGADLAIEVVGQLKDTQGDPSDAAFFGWLWQEFREDRLDLVAFLTDLGFSQQSMKRVAGEAAGSVLKRIAGGKPGDRPLFRTLEALAIAVQGKRCLWRATQIIATSSSLMPNGRTFVELEERAVRQWEVIDDRRRALVGLTFQA